MSLKPEQIGRDRRWVSLDGPYIKKSTNRWRRRKWKQDPEAHFAKYKGYAG